MQNAKISGNQQIKNKSQVMILLCFIIYIIGFIPVLIFPIFFINSLNLVIKYQDKNPYTDDGGKALYEFIIHDSNQFFKVGIIFYLFFLIISVEYIYRHLRQKYFYNEVEIQEFLKANPPKTNYKRLFFVLLPALIGAFIFTYFMIVSS